MYGIYREKLGPVSPGSKNYWSDIEVISTQYNLNIAPIGFAAWVAVRGVNTGVTEF